MYAHLSNKLKINQSEMSSYKNGLMTCCISAQCPVPTHYRMASGSTYYVRWHPLNNKMYENLEALKTALFLRATGVPIVKWAMIRKKNQLIYVRAKCGC